MKNDEKVEARERLLAAGLNFFANKGYDGATVREICDAANSNIAAINYYFGDKQGFYAAVKKYAHGIRQQSMARCWELAETDPWAALELHIDIMLDEAYDDKMFQTNWLFLRELLEKEDAPRGEGKNPQHLDPEDENKRLQYVNRMSHLLSGLLGPEAATPENFSLLHYTYHSLCRFLPIKSVWESRMLQGKAKFSVRTMHDKATLKAHILGIVRSVVEDMQRKEREKKA